MEGSWGIFKGLIILWVMVFLGEEVSEGMEVVKDSEKILGIMDCRF